MWKMKVGNKNKINDPRFGFEAELVSTLFESVKTGLEHCYNQPNIFLSHMGAWEVHWDKSHLKEEGSDWT